MSRAWSALLALLVATALLGAGCGDFQQQLDQLLGKTSPSPTDSGVTPTPSGTQTTSGTAPTPTVSTVGAITTFDYGTVSLPAGSSPKFSLAVPATAISID